MGKTSEQPIYLALCGGVGGAKLADGLASLLSPNQLRLAVNVGDDFELLSLYVCPDLDTVLYTLAGQANKLQGWGREAESWNVLEEIRRLGGEDWFLLGDKDIALHLMRGSMLSSGLRLTGVIAEIARRFGVQTTILPVTDDRLRTMVETDMGRLQFQEYFVRRRCEPTVYRIEFDGADEARLNPRIEAVLEDPALAGVIICPSNPYLSIEPMLAIRPFREMLRTTQVPVVAVSPIVDGVALKGPAAKIMRELGRHPTAAAIADIYEDIVDIVIVDECDSKYAICDAPLRVARTVMSTEADRRYLAQVCIGLIDDLRAS